MTPFDLPFNEGRDKGLLCPESHLQSPPAPDLENIIWYSRHLKPDDIYSDIAAFLARECKITGQNKNIQRCLRQLIANLIRLQRYCPDAYLAFPRQYERWTRDTRYKNPYRIGRKIIDIVDALIENGYLEYHRGFQGERRNYVSRIKPNSKFIETLETFDLLTKPVEYWPSFPLVRVNITDDTENECYPANESSHVNRMVATLERYNALLAEHTISAEACIVNDQYAPPLHHTGEPVYRVFNSDCLKHGGRFYGAFWANCKKEQRKKIKIDGKDTIELDYKAQHIYLAYGLYADHPYSYYFKAYDAYKITNLTETARTNFSQEIEYPRIIMKLAALAILNANSHNHAFQGLRHSVYKLPYELMRQCMPYVADKNNSFQSLYDDFCDRHAPIEKLFLSGIGTTLQYYDSQIADFVIHNMTMKNIPCLSVHDSFIVTRENEGLLRDLMQEAYYKLNLSNSLPPIE